MTIIKDGEIVAVYHDDTVVCAFCAAAEGQGSSAREESLQAEELEGIIDELWRDRCGAGIFFPLLTVPAATT